jgi:hypothetical protein
MSELLAMFKKSIGDLSDSTELDDYYSNFLIMAQAQLKAEDISDTVLATDLGNFATVLCAKLLMNDESVADNSTLILLRNLLTAQTKGERHK